MGDLDTEQKAIISFDSLILFIVFILLVHLIHNNYNYIYNFNNAIFILKRAYLYYKL